MPRHPNPSRPQITEWIEAIHVRRLDLGLTLNQLAKAAGIHVSMLGKALNPSYGATADTVEAIEIALSRAEVAAQHAEHDAPKGIPVVKPEPVKELDLQLSATWGKVSTAPDLNGKVTQLADQQNTFWNELSVAMRRLTALEADRREPGLLAEAELETRIYTLRSEFQAFRDAANEQIDYVSAATNNLAKSVNIIDVAQDGLLLSVDAHREAIADIHDQIAGLTKTVDARCCPRDDHREAIDYHRNQLLRHHARITDLEIAAEQPGKDNDLGFLELAIQSLTSRVVAMEARDTDFALRVIELLLKRGQE